MSLRAPYPVHKFPHSFSSRTKVRNPSVITSRQVFPTYAEYAYYAIILNAILGLLSVRLLGAAMMAGLATFLIFRLGSLAIRACGRIWAPIGCAASFLVIQATFHGESIMDGYNRQFVTWILMLVIAQCLTFRERFLHRFALASFAIGLLLLPHLSLEYEVTSEYSRAGLDASVGLSNSNELAAWFGFCCVYAIVLAIETKRGIVRSVSLLVVGGSLFVVGLTVSRGALAGIAIATVIAFRGALRRKFVPVLLLMVFGSGVLVSGLFDQTVSSYAARSGEETGRFLTWPVVIQAFANSPLMGIGAANAAIYVPAKDALETPHNGFLFIALTSGVIPLVFFIIYWWQAGMSALHARRAGTADAAFLLPLVLYSFVVMSLSNESFMAYWLVVTLSVSLAQRSASLAVRMRPSGTTQTAGRQYRAWTPRT